MAPLELPIPPTALVIETPVGFSNNVALYGLKMNLEIRTEDEIPSLNPDFAPIEIILVSKSITVTSLQLLKEKFQLPILLVIHEESRITGPIWVIENCIITTHILLSNMIHHTVTSSRAQKSLALQKIDREKKLNALLEGSPDGILVVNAEGKIEMVNQRVETLFGYHRNELLQQELNILIPEVSKSKHPGLVDSFRKAPQNRPMGMGTELSGRHRDGQNIPLSISLSYISLESGELVVASLRDLREWKKNQEKN